MHVCEVYTPLAATIGSVHAETSHLYPNQRCEVVEEWFAGFRLQAFEGDQRKCAEHCRPQYANEHPPLQHNSGYSFLWLLMVCQFCMCCHGCYTSVPYTHPHDRLFFVRDGICRSCLAGTRPRKEISFIQPAAPLFSYEQQLRSVRRSLRRPGTAARVNSMQCDSNSALLVNSVSRRNAEPSIRGPPRLGCLLEASSCCISQQLQQRRSSRHGRHATRR
jgi:hypothetical protein